jgi:hypothetical protein
MTKNGIDLIKTCLSGQCLVDDEWEFNIFQKWFFTIKTVVCILLGRVYTGKDWDWYSYDIVTVAIHSFREFYNYEFGMQDASFVNITVAHEWNIWYYYELSDGWL